jgi:sugar-specific transcriptional regulator TrmB
VIREHPGSKPSELAEATGIGNGYIYKVLARAESRGLATGDDQGWHVTESKSHSE